jgi:hypothetical protein
MDCLNGIGKLITERALALSGWNRDPSALFCPRARLKS